MLLSLMALFASLAPSPRQAAQKPEPEVASQSRTFPTPWYLPPGTIHFPVQLDEAKRPFVARVLVFLSTDMGRSWKVVSDEPPTVTQFTFFPPKDGEYWFSLQTIDKQGGKIPTDVTREPPETRVIVWEDPEYPAPAFAFPTATYLPQGKIHLPVLMDEAARNSVARVLLFLSTDMGRTWKVVSDGPATVTHFKFDATKNGEYWFSLQTIDKNGRKYRENVTQQPPGRRVIVWKESEPTAGDVARSDSEK